MALLRRSQRGHELFPGFTDVAEIGVGSLAVVFRAREIGTNRHVALKLLNVRDASPRSIESFERESIALGALSSHPNIVTLYRVFRTPDGRPVLVLELCTGAVYDRLRDGAGLPVPEAVSVGIKIAGALETAHRGGILHRDVKPQNILITDFGEPALADFGVAMLQSATQTTAGLFDFTTLHAAPELLEGSGTSAATDVYELASSLYQLIAGQSAFRAYEGESPASVILRILRDPVRPLSGQDVPMALSDLLIRAMSKEKDKRPPTAAEFAAELADVEIAEGWNRTQFLIRDPGALGAGVGPTVTRLPDEVPRGLPSTLAPSEPINPVFPAQQPVPVPPVAPVAEWPAAKPSTAAGWTPPAPDAAPAEAPPLPAAAPEPPPERAPVAEVAPPAEWAPPPAAPEQVVPTDWTRFAPPAPRGRRRVPIEIDDEYLPAAGPGGLLSAADYAPRHGPVAAERPAEPPEPPAPPMPPEPSVPEPPAPEPVAGLSPAVPVWAIRAPVGRAASPSTPQFVSELSLEPMSLRPKATLRTGGSAVTITDRQLRLRTWFKRSSVEWADVEGFEVQLDSDSGPTATGQIVALTTLGPVELAGTRRPLAELRYVHALLAAYRIRAQRIANR